MAVAASWDYSSFTSINHCINPHHSVTSTYPSSRSLSFFTLFQHSKPQISHANAPACHPILEEQEKPTNQQENQETQQILSPEVKDWNRILSGLLLDSRKEHLAFGYYEKAKENPEFRPTKSTVENLIRYLMNGNKWDLILLVCKDFRQYDLSLDDDACSKLVSSCIRARKFRTVNAMLEIFKSHEKLALLAFDSAMAGYNDLHMFSSTITVFDKLKSAGIEPNLECYSRVITAYQRTGKSNKVVELVNEFESLNLDCTRNPVSVYRSLCTSLAKSSQACEALKFFKGMTKKGIPPDYELYSGLICSFARLREVSVTEELYKEAEEKNMLKGPETFLRVVLMYVEEGLVERTLEVVNSMKKTNIKVSDCILCAIVNGFSKQRGFQAAVDIYEVLISKGCQPGQVTYASIINAYCRLGVYLKAEMMFKEMEEKGFDKCVVAYSNMIAMYGKARRPNDAMKLVAKMKQKGCKPNVWIYNSLIDMHGRAKDVKRVDKIWKEMKRSKVAPDKVSYTSVIDAYNRAKEYEICIGFYREFRTYGGKLDRAMAGIMVAVFSKTGQADELVKLLQDMKFEGKKLDDRLYFSAYNALLDAGLQLQIKWLQDNFKAA